MFCRECGQKIDPDSKFCLNCGKPASGSDSGQVEPNIKSKPSKVRSFFSSRGIISAIIILVIIAFGIYGSLDSDSIDKNNEGMQSLDAGDYQAAINQFQQASQDAVTNETKITTLINLGYVYISEGQYIEAKKAFSDGLDLAEQGSFEYHLISGEIALLEDNPSLALSNFNKAYQLEPRDFQINNSLALFHLDLEEVAPQYEDYPKALEYAKAAYEYDTEKSAISKQNLAIAYYFNDNYDQTISLLSTTNLTQHPYTNYWLGLAYVANGDNFNGKYYLQRAVDAGINVPQEIYDYLNSY